MQAYRAVVDMNAAPLAMLQRPTLDDRQHRSGE